MRGTHQGQSTLPRLVTFLRSVGVAISKRQLQRLLTDRQEDFAAEAQDVCAPVWRHRRMSRLDDTSCIAMPGRTVFCTQTGNDWFTWFGTRSSKSRLNFLDLLRAGHTDYVLNDEAYGYMRKHGIPKKHSAGLGCGLQDISSERLRSFCVRLARTRPR